MAGVVGTHIIAGETGTPRKTPDAFTPVASEVQLVHRERSPTPSGTPVPAGGQGHLLVDGEGPPPRGNALRDPPPPPPPRSTPILGRVSVRVGSPPPRSVSLRTMVEPGDFATHQHLGDESSVPSASGFSGHDHQPVSDSSVRQLHGSGLRQQAVGDSVRLPLRVDRATSPSDGSPQRAPGSEVPPGAIERPSGSPQPPQPSVRCGVVPPPAGSKDDHPHLGVSDHRPVRNTPQCEAAPVLLPDPRPKSRLRGCLPPRMESSRRVRVPTLPSRREGSGQSRRDPKSLHDADRSPLAGEVVVLLLLTQPPLALTLWDRLLRQPHFHRFHGGVHALNLHAWRLSSVSSESQDFRDELRASCPAVSENPLHACTSRNGSLSVVGVVEGALLQSTPLYP